MSRTKNSILSMLRVFEDILRSHTYESSGIRLNAEQNRIYCDALVLLLTCWYDCIQPQASFAKPRWADTWVRVISTMDVRHLASLLKSADRLLLSSVTEDWYNYECFKRTLCREHPLAGQVIAPLKKLFGGWYRESDTCAFASLHMCLVFLSRLNLPSLFGLEEEAYESYVAGEKNLKICDFTDDETRIIQSWFPYTELVNLLNDWHPKHGGGAVADAKTSLEAKYDAFGWDTGVGRLDLILGGDTMPVKTEQVLSRRAKVIFVPKSIDKLRTICMEPSTLQWYQQGFMRSLVMYINRHNYLSRRISLDDQELSRDLAYDGSIDGLISTIDLSSASDSVSWSMVKQWTRRSALLPICGLTRSKECQLPDGTVLNTKKFAPMGSALCFPMECIIFCAIVEASILEVGGRPRDSLYRVYGDDIIVETKYANAVMNRLNRNGFTVNISKSFFDIGDSHNFRESCGGEYLDGMDVTPIRMSRRFAGYSMVEHLKPSSIAACVDLCNLCFSRLPTVRRIVIKELLELPKAKRPVFDSSGELGIFSPNPTNFHLLPSYYRARYQNFWLKHGGVKVDKSVDSDGLIALYEQLRATRHRLHLFTPEELVDAAMAKSGVVRWGVMTSSCDKIGSQPISPVESSQIK